jgi:glycosyltransferase involved in cell wall biosynthesis
MKKKKVAIVGVKNINGDQGGAEIFFDGLCKAMSDQNIDADLVFEISDESSIDAIKRSYLKFYDIDLSMYDGVVSTKAPSYAARHHNHICYLVHTMRVFYDMFETEFPWADKKMIADRNYIQQLDTAAFAYPRTKKILTIGWEVTNRLKHYNGLESTVVHPAVVNERFTQGKFGNYLFIPGRLHRWKRINLLIEAMEKVSNKTVELYIAGIGEDENHLKKKAKNNSHVHFLGRVTDSDLVKFYSGAFAVPFVPKSEDYGYVTIEAFKSGKPVITCDDSGEPAWFVKKSGGGIVCPPNPRDIATAIDFLSLNIKSAEQMGQSGFEFISNINWENIATILLKGLFPRGW